MVTRKLFENNNIEPEFLVQPKVLKGGASILTQGMLDLC